MESLGSVVLVKPEDPVEMPVEKPVEMLGSMVLVEVLDVQCWWRCPLLAHCLFRNNDNKK